MRPSLCVNLGSIGKPGGVLAVGRLRRLCG